MFKRKDKRGVFGLTAVQGFFAIILGIALLAYIIVIIMGVLGDTPILTLVSHSVVNESNTRPTTAGINLACEGRTRCSCGTITSVLNGTGLTPIAAGNYTQTGCLIVNATDVSDTAATWRITYPYDASSTDQNNLDAILINTSTGITSFFGSISPVYAILAVLVIILVLVVLVRVVQGGSTGRAEQL